MIELVEEDITKCPLCNTYINSGMGIHPEIWYCKNCKNVIAIDLTTAEDLANVERIAETLKKSSMTAKEMDDAFIWRIIRKFHKVYHRSFKSLGILDPADVESVYFIAGYIKPAIPKFIAVNNIDFPYQCRSCDMFDTIHRLISNGTIKIDPFGRYVV